MKYVLIFGLFLLLPLEIFSQKQTKDLNFYINSSLENSPLLKDYNNQLLINQMDSLLQKATYRPQVNFSSTNFWAPTFKGYGYDEVITDGGNYNALLTARQSIIGRGNMKTLNNTYLLENQSVRNAKKISEQDLKSAVTTQYITAYGILKEIMFNEEIQNLLDKEEIFIEKLTENSVYKQTDYLNFQVERQQQSLLIAQQKADYQNNIALLNYLCGIVDTTYVQLEEPQIVLQPSLAFENTLQYYSFQIDSLKIINSDALISYEYHPKLDIYADGGYFSSFTYQPYKNFGASIGFSLTIPIYDSGQQQKRHNKMKLSEQTRKFYQNSSKLQYQQQLRQLYQQLQQTNDMIERTQKVISSSQTLMDAYGKQMQNGDATITDYILAINNYLTAKHTMTQYFNNKLQIINQINYWNYEQKIP